MALTAADRARREESVGTLRQVLVGVEASDGPSVAYARSIVQAIAIQLRGRRDDISRILVAKLLRAFLEWDAEFGERELGRDSDTER